MTETVTEIVESVEKILNDKELSKKVVRQILKDFGGVQIYLPRPSSAFKDEDYREIYETFNGTNSRELCKKFDISFNTLYSIVRKERARRSAERAEKAESLISELDFGK